MLGTNSVDNLKMTAR